MHQYNPDESGMRVDEKAWNALYYEIGREDLEYVDNLRVARKGDPLQMSAYNEKVLSGCCGSMDIGVTIDGIEFAIGCNYGH